MLSLQSGNLRLCDRLTRRESMRLGGLGAFGLNLPDLLAAQSDSPPPDFAASFGRAMAMGAILMVVTGASVGLIDRLRVGRSDF